MIIWHLLVSSLSEGAGKYSTDSTDPRPDPGVGTLRLEQRWGHQGPTGTGGTGGTGGPGRTEGHDELQDVTGRVVAEEGEEGEEAEGTPSPGCHRLHDNREVIAPGKVRGHPRGSPGPPGDMGHPLPAAPPTHVT